jgi:putative thioredoxin
MNEHPHSYEVAGEQFDRLVLAASMKVPVVVDFWADWCQPCRILKPILERLADEYQGRFILAKVDSDANQELAQQLGVRGIPAVKAFVGGRLVDEFTGALPEAQVREFLDRLIPSPAEPLRLQAQEARQAGDLPRASQLLDAAMAADPRHEGCRFDAIDVCIDSGDIAGARQRLDALPRAIRDETRLAAITARLQLAASGGGDIATLRRQVEAAPDDLPARLQLADAEALAGNYRPALQHYLEIVRRDRRWQEEAGRRGMLTLFNLLSAQPAQEDLIREFRIALARLLN